jgi:hypothetical protein
MRILVTLAALTFFVEPASAQIASGRSGSSSMTYFGGQEVWDTLGEFGTCYALREKPAAYQLVATRGGSVEEAAVYKRLFRNQNQLCLGDVSQLSVNHQLVRGAIAEGLYRQSVPVPETLAVRVAPTSEQVRNFGDTALCYAAKHPAEAKALVATRVGSKAEDQAVTAALPNFKPCIPSGAKRRLQVDVTLIRFRVAEALWKLGATPAARRQAAAQ